MGEVCSIDGCRNPKLARTLCAKHYQRWRTTATTEERRPLSEAERFFAKVDRTGDGGCWIWGAATTNHGYGSFCPSVRVRCLAHRWTYHWMVDASLPLERERGGDVLDHLCRTPACVNPDHLEVVSHRENVGRGLQGDLNRRRVSKFRGVSWDPQTQRWRPRISINGHRPYLGVFVNERDAAHAYCTALEAVSPTEANQLRERIDG